MESGGLVHGSWFAAVVPPPQTFAGIATKLHHNLEPELSVKWKPRQSWHITTAFCEDPHRDEGKTLCDILLKQVTTSPRWVGLRLVGAGFFGNHIWVGVDVPDEVKVWVEETQQVLREKGFNVPNRPWLPHLTVGKTKNPSAVVEQVRDKINSAPFSVDKLFVMKGGRLGGGGFLRVAAVPLPYS